MPLRNRFVLVGNLTYLRTSNQHYWRASDIWQCDMSSNCIPCWWIQDIHVQTSSISTCNTKKTYTPLPSPPTSIIFVSTSTPPHPKSNVCAQLNYLFSDKSNKRRNLTQKGTSPIHNKVLEPLPTFRRKLLGNQLPNAEPTPSWMLTISLATFWNLRGGKCSLA